MIVVTGASRGLGHEISKRIIGTGDEVFGLARDVSELDFPAESCDVADPASVSKAAKKVRETGKKVTGLINCAGVASMNLVMTSSVSQIENLVKVNLLGTIFACRAFSPLMVRTGFGRIINFSSIAVKLAIAGEATYAASKGGIETFTRAFAREMSGHDITVNCIAPGPIPTDMMRGVSSAQIDRIIQQQVIRRQFSSDDVCDVIELLLLPSARSLSGQILNLGGA